ncbi:3-oxo-tetronate 4-phosphate decarboxylase [Aureimonas sp. SA4125]|uniref:3-oxo-tetronate 4-phosphate decarboxylase n=1 Tax=Aureimonas sp. SA4125 TaxID=2826993 RepID=UPI001CC5D249|nr:3-oxo-tetronate 4-phosphate decarboxylase [Aureimonas sp. SA4125]
MQDLSETELRAAIVRQGALLYERRLAHGTAGNLSVRLKDGAILVTPTNSSLGFLDPQRISKVSPEGDLLSGDPPSKEAFFHRAVYAARPTARAIVHLHSTHSVAISCLCHADPSNVMPPLTAYHVMKVGRLPLVGYFRPGDRRLAAAVGDAARDHHAMLLANHGPIIAGRSLEEAVQIMEELEETAKLYFLIGDRPASPLSCEAVEELAAAFPS